MTHPLGEDQTLQDRLLQSTHQVDLVPVVVAGRTDINLHTCSFDQRPNTSRLAQRKPPPSLPITMR